MSFAAMAKALDSGFRLRRPRNDDDEWSNRRSGDLPRRIGGKCTVEPVRHRNSLAAQKFRIEQFFRIATRREFPGVSIRLHPSDEVQILARLAQGSDDLAVISTSGAVPEMGVAVPLFRWRRVVVLPAGHPLARRRKAPGLRELSALPLVSYESSRRPESSLRRAFDAAELPLHLAMTAHDADLIKTYVRAGLGIGILAEMAVVAAEPDLHALPAPAALPECITWAVLPRGRVVRDYALWLLQELAPQIGAAELRQAVAGNAEPTWPAPPAWRDLQRATA